MFSVYLPYTRKGIAPRVLAYSIRIPHWNRLGSWPRGLLLDIRPNGVRSIGVEWLKEEGLVGYKTQKRANSRFAPRLFNAEL